MPDSHEADRPFNVYLDFAQPLSLDSMEGVPSVAPVAPALPGLLMLVKEFLRIQQCPEHVLPCLPAIRAGRDMSQHGRGSLRRRRT